MATRDYSSSYRIYSHEKDAWKDTNLGAWSLIKWAVTFQWTGLLDWTELFSFFGKFLYLFLERSLHLTNSWLLWMIVVVFYCNSVLLLLLSSSLWDRAPGKDQHRR